MKYLIVLGDGMADRPTKELEGKTPLQVASKPNIDMLAKRGTVGLVRTIPNGCTAGSDVANLSVLGYDPRAYYTGRAPLEALSMGVKLEEGDLAVRTNLVTLSSHESFNEKRMVDYSAGEIPTEQSSILMQSIEKALGNEKFHFYPGVAYRHLMVVKDGESSTVLTPPHDISGQRIDDYLPEGEDAEEYTNLIIESGKILENHPVNVKREEEGNRPATHIWFWGGGTKPELPSFSEKYGLSGAVVSAVDLMRGIAKGTGMSAPKVRGATGTLQTNWNGKISAAIEQYESGKDFVYIHLEAPDECSHQGDIRGKVAAIERVDYVLGKMYAYLKDTGKDFRIAVLPDHATPLNIMTHSSEPVPYLIYKSDQEVQGCPEYNEEDAQNGPFLDDAGLIMKTLIS